MTATKNQQKGYWEIQFYYKDWTGTRRKKHKRGFKTKREAIEWAEDFKQKQSQSMDMLLRNLIEVYFEDMENRLRESTIKNKKYIINSTFPPVKLV